MRDIQDNCEHVAISMLKLSLNNYRADSVDMQMKFDDVTVYQMRFG